MATYAAPVVQNLNDIVAELQPSVQGQTDVINKQKEASAAIYDAQRAGLDAAKTQGFNDINTQATGRGMTFSGIPLNEQAAYLSTKYLPGVQAANAQQNADALAYDRSIADLNANIFNKAFDTRTTQQRDLTDWNKMLSGQDFSRSERIAGQDFTKSEREASQSFTADQNQKERDFKAAQNAADRASRGGGAGSAPNGGAAGARAFLLANANSDGKVNPSVWAAAVDLASQGGMGFGGDQGFASTFWSFADDGNWQKYKLGYDKYMK